MTVREKMIDIRTRNGLSLTQLSKACGVSELLLGMVEGGNVTHPLIVSKIQKAYGLSDEEAEELMPENHRKSSDNYEPDKYVVHLGDGSKIVCRPIENDIMRQIRSIEVAREIRKRKCKARGR